MFNFIRVSFPEADSGPTAVYSAEIIQEKYKHDIIKIKFRDWDVSYDVLNPGSPVQVTITGVTEQKNIFSIFNSDFISILIAYLVKKCILILLKNFPSI